MRNQAAFFSLLVIMGAAGCSGGAKSGHKTTAAQPRNEPLSAPAGKGADKSGVIPDLPRPQPVPLCAPQLKAALMPKQTLFLQVANGTAGKCLPFMVSSGSSASSGTLRHSASVVGEKWVYWTRSVFVDLRYKRTGNTLSLTWSGAGSSHRMAYCGKYTGGLGFNRTFTSNPPVCADELTAARCDGNAIHFRNATLFLTKQACETALAAKPSPFPLGKCASMLATHFASTHQPPQFPAPVLAAARKLEALTRAKSSVYWLEPDRDHRCQKWRLEPGTKDPQKFNLVRNYREKRRRVEASYDFRLKGIELFLGGRTETYTGPKGTLGGSASGSRGRCRRITGSGKHHFAFEHDLKWFTNKRACTKALRAWKAAQRKGRKTARRNPLATPPRKPSKPARKTR